MENEYQYIALSQDERDKIVLDFYLAQERDHFCHSINKQRYEAMLPDLPEGDFKLKVEKNLQDTNDRISEVSVILDKTRPQLPTQEKIDALVSVMVNK